MDFHGGLGRRREGISITFKLLQTKPATKRRCTLKMDILERESHIADLNKNQEPELNNLWMQDKCFCSGSRQDKFYRAKLCNSFQPPKRGKKTSQFRKLFNVGSYPFTRSLNCFFSLFKHFIYFLFKAGVRKVQDIT